MQRSPNSKHVRILASEGMFGDSQAIGDMSLPNNEESLGGGGTSEKLGPAVGGAMADCEKYPISCKERNDGSDTGCGNDGDGDKPVPEPLPMPEPPKEKCGFFKKLAGKCKG